MATYLVEAYLPRARQSDLAPLVERLRAAASEVADAGTPIRYLRSTFVPEDDTCFHVFEASSAAAVSAASALAGLGGVRIVEAIREGERTP